jgi:DNA-binding MarR family transcriptional regulator
MEDRLAKRMIDAFHETERILNLMPALPPGMTPQYIRVLEAVHDLEQEKGGARGSEIAERLKLTRPGVTRSLKAMEKIGAVEKRKDTKDGRAVQIVLTRKGQNWYVKYVQVFYEHLCMVLDDIPDQKIRDMIGTIHTVREKMEESREVL